MTTTSERVAVRPTRTAARRTRTATVADRPAPPTSATRRYVDDVVGLHGGLTYGGLEAAIEGQPLVRLASFDDGLTTLTVRQSQLPERYVKAILGFRLAQFLQVGMMDPALAYRHALYHEPLTPAPGPETLHTVTLTETGRIVGYLGLVGSPDADPLALDSPDRIPFAAEEAHHVDLLSRYADPSLTSHEAYEIKRFVRDPAMPRGPQRDRVSWHLILSLGRTILTVPGEIRILLGDAREKGAIRHMNLTGFDLVVIEDTEPSLAHEQLMWPSYEVPRERRAKPFVAPIRDDFSSYMDTIEAGLRSDQDGWQRTTVTRLAALRQAARRAHEVQA